LRTRAPLSRFDPRLDSISALGQARHDIKLAQADTLEEAGSTGKKGRILILDGFPR
jgi:hypothetical protein